MPTFRTNENIFENWDIYYDKEINEYSSSQKKFPPSKNWTYERNMTIEDVNVWETIFYSSYRGGLHVSWDPYAEFYMLAIPEQVVPGFSCGIPYGKDKRYLTHNIVTFYDKRGTINANLAVENYLINTSFAHWRHYKKNQLNKNIFIENVVIEGIDDYKKIFYNYHQQ
jgi:hypothetical protein